MGKVACRLWVMVTAGCWCIRLSFLYLSPCAAPSIANASDTPLTATADRLCLTRDHNTPALPGLPIAARTAQQKGKTSAAPCPLFAWSPTFRRSKSPTISGQAHLPIEFRFALPVPAEKMTSKQRELGVTEKLHRVTAKNGSPPSVQSRPGKTHTRTDTQAASRRKPVLRTI